MHGTSVILSGDAAQAVKDGESTVGRAMHAHGRLDEVEGTDWARSGGPAPKRTMLSRATTPYSWWHKISARSPPVTGTKALPGSLAATAKRALCRARVTCRKFEHITRYQQDHPIGLTKVSALGIVLAYRGGPQALNSPGYKACLVREMIPVDTVAL